MKLITHMFGSSSAKPRESKREIRKKKKKMKGANPSSSFGSSITSSSSSDESSAMTPPRSVLTSAAGAKDKENKLAVALTREELEAALRSIVVGSNKDELLADDSVLEEVATAAADEGELKETFAVFDADGDGRISAEELRAVLASLGDDQQCSVEDCRRMIRGVDTDGDGFVCFDEFTRMMMH